MGGFSWIFFIYRWIFSLRWMAYCSPGNPVIPDQEISTHFSIIIIIYRHHHHNIIIIIVIITITSSSSWAARIAKPQLGEGDKTGYFEGHPNFRLENHSWVKFQCVLAGQHSWQCAQSQVALDSSCLRTNLAKLTLNVKSTTHHQTFSTQ